MLVVCATKLNMLLILAFLAVVAFSNAVHLPGTESVYNYHARIGVGTFEPVSFASEFTLEGKLHLQYETKDSILIRFTDLTYKLYNGQLNQQDEFESNSLPLPEVTADLLRVFRLEYDEHRKLQYITTEINERRYSRNIKKAIASILQLDLTKIQINSDVPHAFITEESSIYGKGLVEYNVIPQGKEIIVQKLQDVKSSRHWYNYFGINIEPQYTGVSVKSPVSVDSHRQYTLVRSDNTISVKQILAHGGIYVHPFNGLYDSQYVSVNQSLDLIETIPIVTSYTLNNGERTDQLEFRFEAELESGAFDETCERHRENKEENIQMLHNILEDAQSYLENNQLTMNSPDLKNGQAINRLHRIVSKFDVPTLEQVYASLNEKTLQRDQELFKIFQQILPLVGTRATTIFIRNLVRKVSDKIAIDMLNKLPFNLRMPSKKLLIEVEDLLDLGNDVSPEVRKTGILCFSSLIHKVFAHNSWQEHNHEHHHIDNHEHIVSHYPGNWNSYHTHQHVHPHAEHVQESTGKENQLLERYIVHILDLLKSSQDYETQYLYMMALYNIQVGNVAKYLEPYVKGEVENLNRHLRFLAMCASISGVVSNPEKVFTVYWPIFTNRNLHLELRTAAYNVIMITQPTMSKYWNIYWYMQTEHCPELYHYYYTHLQSLATTTNPLKQEQKTCATQILKFVRKPFKPTASGNYLFEYTDPKYGYGATVQSSFISTRTSKMFYVDLTNHIGTVPFNYYAIYFKIDGLDASIADKLPKENVVRYNLLELQELVQFISTLQDQKTLHVEYSIVHYNQVVQIGYYDSTNIKKLVDNFQNIEGVVRRLFQNTLQIQFNLLSQLVLPNDLGFPTVVQVKVPSITKNVLNFTRDVVNSIINVHGEVRLQTSIQNTNDLTIYNPIIDVWQGILRIRSYDQVIPINFNVAINSQLHTVKLTLNKIQNEESGTVGLRSHVTSYTYLAGYKRNVLQESNEKCRNFEEVGRGQQNKKKYNLYQVDDENTGLRYEIAVFDSERYISQKNIKDLITSLVRNENQNIPGAITIRSVLTLRNLWTRLVLFPGTETAGLVIRAVPSTKHQVSQIDLSLRYNLDVNREVSAQVPSTKLSTRATYSIKADGVKHLKTWDINAVVELNPVHTVNNFKVQITKIVPDQKDYKICVDGIKKWTSNGVTGHLSIAVGRSADGKCVKDEALIDINMKGEPSYTQVKRDSNGRYLYDECSLTPLYIPNLTDVQKTHYRTVECLQKNTDIRKYEYDVKATRVPEGVSQSLLHLLDIIKQIYNPYYSQEEISTPIEENRIKVVVEYPLVGNEIKLQVVRPEKSYNVSGIQIPLLSKLGLVPDNYLLSRKFLSLYKLGLITSCFVCQDTILTGRNNIISHAVSNQWTPLITDSIVDKTFSVSVRRIQESGNSLALRVVLRDQTLEIIPVGDQKQISINGQALDVEEYVPRQGDWYSIVKLNDVHQSVILNVHNFGLYIDFTVHAIKFDVPKYSSGLTGSCFSS